MKKTAIITDEDEEISYSELYDMMKEFNGNFRSDTRSTFMIVCTNTVGSLIGYLSGIYFGNVSLLLNEKVKSDNVRQYENDYKFNYLWAADEWLDKEGNDYLDKYRVIFCKYNYSLLKLNEKHHVLNEKLALLLTTSGTTGSNKLVRISKENILENTKAISEYLEITDKERAITSLPMNYTYGLSVINTHLYNRGTLVLTEKKVFSMEFWERFEKYDVNSFSGVPYTYELIKRLGIMSKDILSLKVLTVAGGKIGTIEEEYFTSYAEKYNKKFIIMYGQTEATARISYRPWKDRGKIGSIGIPIPGGKMWLEDDSGNIVTKPYENGDIVYSGKNVTMGYAYGKEDLSNGEDRKGILNTGDLGYIDEDGYFYIVRRSDRLVKLNGHRVDLENMEKMLREYYPKHIVRCDIEKCADSQMQKVIKVEMLMSKTEPEKINEADVRKILNKKVSINSKLINIVTN